MPDQIEVTMSYDIPQDVLIIKSPMSEMQCCFQYENIWEFIEWLVSGRYRHEQWYHLEMEFRYYCNARILVMCQGEGRHVDFYAFSGDDDLFEIQVTSMADAIRTIEKDMIHPAKAMKAEGMDDQAVLMRLKNMNIFDLPVIWQRDP